MSLPDILEIDLPTMILIVVLWLIDHFKQKRQGQQSPQSPQQR